MVKKRKNRNGASNTQAEMKREREKKSDERKTACSKEAEANSKSFEPHNIDTHILSKQHKTERKRHTLTFVGLPFWNWTFSLWKLSHKSFAWDRQHTSPVPYQTANNKWYGWILAGDTFSVVCFVHHIWPFLHDDIRWMAKQRTANSETSNQQLLRFGRNMPVARCHDPGESETDDSMKFG